MCSDLDHFLEQAKRDNYTNLHLNYQNFEEIPKQVLHITSVRRLYLKRNLLKSLPSDLWKLTQLVELYLPSNKLECLPDDIGKLKTLQCLNVDNNFLRRLPKTIGELANMRKLQISNNEIGVIGPEIGKLKLLEVIEAINNQLTSLPEELESCTNLTALFVDKNRIEEIPKSLRKLVKLKELSMCRNSLFHLPQDLYKLCNLEYLTVDNNPKLIVIPSSILTIQSLTTLGMNGCGINPSELNDIEEVTKWYCGVERIRTPEGNVPQLLELSTRACSYNSKDQEEMDFLRNSLKRDIASPMGHCYVCFKPYFWSAFVHLSDVNEACRIANVRDPLYSKLKDTKCYFAFCFCSLTCLLDVFH